MLMDVEYIMPLNLHKQIVQAAFEKRGFTEKESSQAADFSEQASWHGLKTHNALKAANDAGTIVSDDLNFRSKLWSSEDAIATTRPLVQYIDCVNGHILTVDGGWMAR